MATQLNNTKSLAYATGEMKAVDSRPKPTGLVVSVSSDLGNATFNVALRSKVTIGRGDDQSPVDVDLTSFGALEKGVSRKHLMLMQHGTRVFMLDLGSTNGTQVNGKALRTGSIYELKDKDEVTLGKLKLSVTFTYNSATAPAVATSLLTENRVEAISQGVQALNTVSGNDQGAAPVAQSVAENPATPSSDATDVQSAQQASPNLLKRLGTVTSDAADVQAAVPVVQAVLEHPTTPSSSATDVQSAQQASPNLLKRLGTLPGNAQDSTCPETIPDIHNDSSEAVL